MKNRQSKAAIQNSGPETIPDIQPALAEAPAANSDPDEMLRAARLEPSTAAEEGEGNPNAQADPDLSSGPFRRAAGSSIFTFNVGDVIINVLPLKRKRYVTGFGYSTLWGGSSEVEEPDMRYRQPLEFLGIQNNMIYLRSFKGSGYGASRYLYKVPLDELENGWELFVLPENVTMEEAAGVP